MEKWKVRPRKIGKLENGNIRPKKIGKLEKWKVRPRKLGNGKIGKLGPGKLGGYAPCKRQLHERTSAVLKLLRKTTTRTYECSVQASPMHDEYEH